MRQLFFIAANAPENQYNWSSSLKMIGQFFYIILIFAAIILMAYFVTKWIAGAKMGNKTGKGNIKLMESYPITMQASLQLLKVGRKYLLVGVTKDRLCLLTELNEEDIQIESQSAQVLPFESILKRYVPSFTNKIKDSEKEDADD